MRKSRLWVLACVMLLAGVMLAMPATASAAVDSVTWSAPVYQGPDNYYGVPVVAYTAGSTANVTVQVTNDQPADVTIREARITVDFGLATPSEGQLVSGPTTLKVGQTGSFSFAVTMPSNAPSTVLHSYQVKIGYQRQDGPASYIDNFQPHQNIGTGNGATVVFSTVSAPVVATSLRVSWLNTAVVPNTVVVQDPATYTLDARTGRITFTSAPPAGTQIWVDYQYLTSIGAGNGVNNVFMTTHRPVVNGTLQVFLVSAITGEFTPASVASVDYEAGKIVLATPPTGFQSVFATYEWWSRWQWGGTNLAVYGADQSRAMTSFQEYTALVANAPVFWVPLSTGGAQAQTNAAVFAAQAQARYAAGDFSSAASLYEQALVQLKASYQANNGLSATAETAVSNLVKSAAPVVESYSHMLEGEGESARGQSSMYKNVGVFSILLGVATLFAGIGGIVWAYSRLVEARSHHDVR